MVKGRMNTLLINIQNNENLDFDIGNERGYFYQSTRCPK